MITIIQNYNIEDIKREISRMLEESTQSLEIRQLALQITSQTPYNGDQISPIYDFVQENVRYQPDPYRVELFIHPRKMIEFYRQGIAAGDCDDMAILATALYRSLGIESNVILLDTGGQGISHAISRARSEKLGWVNVDPTDKVHPLGWEIAYVKKVVV